MSFIRVCESLKPVSRNLLLLRGDRTTHGIYARIDIPCNFKLCIYALAGFPEYTDWDMSI